MLIVSTPSIVPSPACVCIFKELMYLCIVRCEEMQYVDQIEILQDVHALLYMSA